MNVRPVMIPEMSRNREKLPQSAMMTCHIATDCEKHVPGHSVPKLHAFACENEGVECAGVSCGVTIQLERSLSQSPYRYRGPPALP